MEFSDDDDEYEEGDEYEDDEEEDDEEDTYDKDSGAPAAERRLMRRAATSASSNAPRNGTRVAVRVLPAGWVAVPSKSRPGEMAYKHTETGTTSAEMPTLRNQQMLIDAYLVEASERQ